MLSKFVLSHRLQAILEHIVGDCLADIGTDHGYLPIQAILDGRCKKAIACDIRPGPLGACEANVRTAGLADCIDIRLGDGLQPLLPGEADTIVISGMGGMAMWNIILEEIQKAKLATRLILQPQHDLEELRKNLHAVGFEIFFEKLAREGSRFYVILGTRYTGTQQAWTPKEYFLGKHLLLNEDENLHIYLAAQHEKISRYIQSINDEKSRETAENRLKWIKDTVS